MMKGWTNKLKQEEDYGMEGAEKNGVRSYDALIRNDVH